MPLPFLHIFHPRESRLPNIGKWLAEVCALLKSDAAWDGCIVRVVEYDLQASFDVPTQSDLIKRHVGPIILIEKVQHAVRDRLERLLNRCTCLYCVTVSCSEDIYQACETARQGYEDGEPRIPEREVLGYLIIRKLAAMDRWGGTSLNKSFLWSELLPKGGFPKALCDRRTILDIAEQLVRLDVLTKKISSGQTKYALAKKNLVQPILDTKSFAAHPRYRELRAFFERNPRRVSVRELDYND